MCSVCRFIDNERGSAYGRRAYTLIELLVTVAILAILAALSVPTLENVQVRAKVSRTKADMRAMATALECYSVDYARFPTFHFTAPTFEFFMGGMAGPSYYADTSYQGNAPLTTPIAYMTKLPDDLFFLPDGLGPAERKHFMYINWYYAGERKLYDAPDFFQSALQSFGHWHLISAGPSMARTLAPMDQTYIQTVYDATNGTNSAGKIYRSHFDATKSNVGVWI